MKHRMSSLILTLICFFTLCSSLMAAVPRVNDLADLLSLDEIESLEKRLDILSETYQMETVIVTTNDAEGKTATAYADDFYDTNGYGYGDNWDGILFLIDMDNRELAISTSGLSAKYVDDRRINTLMDTIAPYLTDANYYQGCITFINGVETYFKSGIPSDSHLIFQDGKKPFTNSYGTPLTAKNYLVYAGIAFLAALVMASIVRAIISYRYKHPRHTVPATLPDRLSVNYTEKQDQFISTHTTRTKIETSNSGRGGGGGGSSMHTSSSGRSHGGGSRGF